MTIINEDDRQKASNIYGLYSSTMLRVANSILNNKNLAEDAVSEAFIKIINNLEKINMNDCYKTKGFVVIITRHISLNMLKEQSRNKTVSFEDYIDYSENDEPVLEVITTKEACSSIADSIANLNKNYSNVLYLKYEMDCSVEEISTILDISMDNVRMRLSRARKALKDQLKKDGIYCG